MYGYVVPDKSKLKGEEFVLFAAFYCGICKTIKRNFNQISRYTTNYDITFFAALMCDQLNCDVHLKKENCIGNPFTHKPMVQENALMRRIADMNIIMTYYKALDNMNDGERGAKIALRLFKKAYNKASARETGLDNAFKLMYDRLKVHEKAGQQSPDIAADCFASLLKDCTQIILDKNADEYVLGLAYNIGKFIYLADALDDINEDYVKHRYNPFIACFKEYKGRAEFIEANRQQLEFIFASTVNRAIECFNSMRFNQSYGLIQNIVYHGLRQKTNELLSSKRKLKRPKI